MPKKRGFGSVRKLASGRWQARYLGSDGVLRPAPQTFDRKRDAEQHLADVQSDRARGRWVDPRAGSVTLAVYGERWINEHPSLEQSTSERYISAFRLYLLPYLGHLAINEIDAASVRQWYSQRLREGKGRPSVAKAYRLLRAMLNTAVDDDLVSRNPCRVRGAGEDGSPERPTLRVDQVYSVLSEMPERFRAMVLLATFTTLRLGELAALRRRDLDLTQGWVTVSRGLVELSTGRLVIKGPKSDAGNREVGIPTELLPELRKHVEWFAQPGPDGHVFVGPKGGYIRRQNFRRLWVAAVGRAGVTHVHFHDLRHTGNKLAAESGANLRELMERMGHSSPRAALIYLHGAKDRQRAIADALNAHIPDAEPESPAS